MRRLLVLELFLLASFSFLRADDRSELEARLRQEYKGKVVFLRHLYSGEDLRFDPSGNKLKGDAPTSWTTDAEVKITDLRLDGDKLEIKGRRLFLICDGSKEGFRSFDANAPQGVRITLELPSATPTEDSVRGAWKNVFLAPGDNLGQIAPPYWQPFFRSFAGKASAAPAVEDAAMPAEPGPGEGAQVLKVGSGVSPPKIIFAPDPEYSKIARASVYQGTVVLYLVVGADGLPRNVQIARCIGLGLDDAAAAAVSQWKFEPAKKDGKPVAVAINVEVRFHLGD